MSDGIKIELNVGDALDDFLDQIVITRLKQAIRNLDNDNLDAEDEESITHLKFVLEYFGGEL